MTELEPKPLSPEAIPRALEKAERYRLLNEPWEAESICLDALRVAPDNPEALVTLILARTEQFDEGPAGIVESARSLLPKLPDAYARAYYGGIVSERLAKAHLRRGGPDSGAMAADCLREAMAFYEQAEALRPPGNDDALLRWNACLRLRERFPHLAPAYEEFVEPPLE
jgi:tetratricopeptide (TPR) repeat protein